MRLEHALILENLVKPALGLALLDPVLLKLKGNQSGKGQSLWRHHRQVSNQISDAINQAEARLLGALGALIGVKVIV